MRRKSSRAWILVVLAAAGACSRQPSDSDLQAAAMVHLSMDQGLSHSDLTATVADHVVSLEGRTHTRDNQRRAVEIVRAIPGVKDVRATLRLFDAAIQEAVAAALHADPTIGKIPIAATVSNGVVRLESSATGSADRSRAIEVTRAVDGVVKVDDFMR